MKKAIEIFNSHDKLELREYDETLTALGFKGKLGVNMLFAQRAQAKVAEVLNHEVIDLDYLRFMISRCDNAVERLVKFCRIHEKHLKLHIREFKYGIRIKIHGEQAIRFRREQFRRKQREPKFFWMGDDSNLEPICLYCDRLLDYAGRDGRTGSLFTGITPQ